MRVKADGRSLAELIRAGLDHPDAGAPVLVDVLRQVVRDELERVPLGSVRGRAGFGPAPDPVPPVVVKDRRADGTVAVRPAPVAGKVSVGRVPSRAVLREEICPHPKGRISKGLCMLCGTHVEGKK